MNPNTDIVGT